ncbi:MAG: Omp28-related outer membrane protein [Ignavibacteriae bacterium]|nr:Omp28-related outer membrane protein [Ignavibacteriota bacterium]
MKKVLFTVLVLAFMFGGILTKNAMSLDTNNVLLEYCTGTWCGYCPCAHQILRDNIMPTYPKTVVVGYHGTSSDPWYPYSQTMISTFGFSGYPTGVVGRTTGIISRSSWYSAVSAQALQQPGIISTLTNKIYNGGTRLLTATANFTARQNLPAGDYRIMVILTEDNLVYPQNHYSSCGYSGYINDYVHKHVVKHVVNPPYGDSVTSQAWNNGTVISKQISVTVPTHIQYTNLNLVVFVYKNSAPISTASAVQNSIEATMSDFTITGIENPNQTVKDFYLGQNYPNPFNPMTNIRFYIPKDNFTTLKVYDIRGKLVSTYLNQFVTAGYYNVDFNGSNLSSGVYYYKLTSGNFTDTKKMILVK